MTKGPVPQKAIDTALPVAMARGFVILCRRVNGSGADFVIAGPGWTAVVTICRTKQLNELVADMAMQFPLAIAGLARVPPAPGRSCEIWACDYYGNIRFFRVAGTGLVEIGRDGNLLAGPAGAGEISFPPPHGEVVPG
jgi:hypothetical protein